MSIDKNTEQDTGKNRKNIKDQFYTNSAVAKDCIDQVLSVLPCVKDYLWIEPSAGNGAFLNNLPLPFHKIGIDIDPQCDNVIKSDFLEWIPPCNEPIIIFGNPPFGRQSSLAKRFIARSCQFADVIAFILPKSFTKPSMNNVFSPTFHCIHSYQLGENSFIINKKAYDVPCVFQIWQKQNENRIVDEKIRPFLFVYVKENEKYHIAFRRIGVNAGKCYINNGKIYSCQSHYFMRYDDSMIPFINNIIQKINLHTFPSNTVGPRSLSKCEINSVLNKINSMFSL
jgi:hypothetical protein